MRLARRDHGTDETETRKRTTTERQAGRTTTAGDVVGGTGLAAGRRSRAAGRAPMTAA